MDWFGGSKSPYAGFPKKLENIILATDSYKVSHYKQYPPGTEYVYSVRCLQCTLQLARAARRPLATQRRGAEFSSRRQFFFSSLLRACSRRAVL